MAIRETSFRYRNDDGGEAAATWIYALNTDGNLNSDTVYRMRIMVEEYNGDTETGFAFTFAYNLNSAGWNQITTSSSVIKAVSSTYVTDEEDTTQQISSGTYISDNNGVTEDATVPGIDFTGNDQAELELVFQIITADISDGDTLAIAVGDSGVGFLDDYIVNPSITVQLNTTISANTGVFTLSGVSADLLANRTMAANAGSFALTGIDANLTYTPVTGYDLEADVGSFVLTGQDVNLNANRNIGANLGAYSLTGQAANLQANRTLTANTGTYSLTGISADILATRFLGANVGNFVLTGIGADFILGYTMPANNGAYTLTGLSANLQGAFSIGANAGSYALTGIDATLSYSGTGGAFSIVASAGFYTLVGGSASLSANIIAVDNMEPPPLNEGIYGRSEGRIVAPAWVQWFSKLSKKKSLSPANDSTKFLRSDDSWVVPQLKYYASDAEPTLTDDNTSALWKDTNDSDRVYLVFRRGAADQVKVELT